MLEVIRILTFWIFVALSMRFAHYRLALRQKALSDWALDLASIAIPGFLIPALQYFLIHTVLSATLPSSWRGSWNLPAWAAFLLSFVVMDYVSYWNHRMLHTKPFWKHHYVHHSPQYLDVFVTSRNSIFTHLMFFYVWINCFTFYFLKDPYWFLLGSALSSCSDFWSHSSLYIRPNSKFGKVVRKILITPSEHSWHHSRDVYHINFGSNFSIWDRIHGTYYSNETVPPSIGFVEDRTFFQKLFHRNRAGNLAL
jgi:sterol desaturase/sphingolipid hydroxylase (fatty acid hydroxylase superfamily)